jgi:molybdopterin-guanine dinucleotide biosynthesis protein A
MGQDKAFLTLAGRTLLDRALELAGSLTRDVCIAGDTAKFAAFGPVLEDVYRQRGSLGGIHVTLRRSTSELNLMLALDLPFINLRFLQYLVARRARVEPRQRSHGLLGGNLCAQCIAASLGNRPSSLCPREETESILCFFPRSRV